MRIREAKRVTAQEAIGHVLPGQRLVLPLCCGLPQDLMDALIADHKRLKGTEIVSGLQIVYPFLDENLGGAFTYRTWQCAPPIRHLLKEGTVQYIPMRQGDAAQVFSKRGPWPVDVALIQVSPPDEHGYCSLGVSIGHAHPLAMEADLVIAEVNENMPRVLGRGFLHLSQIDFLVESHRPLLAYPSGEEPGEKEIAIGQYAAELIPDGATLQIGIGAIPEAILNAIGDKQDIRFYAMGIDRIVDLVEKGVVRAGKDPSMIVTELLGSKKLFDFVHDNPMVEGRPIQDTINADLVQLSQFTVLRPIDSLGDETLFRHEEFHPEGGRRGIVGVCVVFPDECIKIEVVVGGLEPLSRMRIEGC